ncbi:MAG: 2'-5' RNA ligase family protein [Acidobacteriia bacterium]|nr:2'-5' RNA ligase family protein [Terriglobia bacterium]
MKPHCNGAARLNSFALVSYIPHPLGSFLDRLRCRLEPDSLKPRAHITLLPPRELCDLQRTEPPCDALLSQLANEPPLRVSLGPIEIFPGTNVIYIAVQAGFKDLLSLHTRLNAGNLECCERFTYHPHITLVQNLSQPEAERVAAQASELWAAYTGPRDFHTDTLTFVQETQDKRWVDLRNFTLNPVPA